MAQDFVGSNNINLLQPNGQFGTRHQGGKDHASARYIYTSLSSLTRFLFPKEDDLILDYLSEDGQSIEPTWYVPIVPMVLVNGSEGIGTGWSSYIPNYNPRDIVKNVRRLLNDEPIVPMDPWYRGFYNIAILLLYDYISRKIIIPNNDEGSCGATYTITGIIEEKNSKIVEITELPIGRWTLDYKEFLESLVMGTDKVKEPFIKDYRDYNDGTTVHFVVTLSEKNLIMTKQEELEKKFELTTTIKTSNMHLFDPKRVIKKYETREQILEEFFHVRITHYEKRKEIERQDAETEVMRIKIKEKAGNVGIAAAKEAPKKPRKNSTKPSAAAKPIAIDSETVMEVTRPKSKGRQNKSTAKPISVESDEDEDLVALKNRLAHTILILPQKRAPWRRPRLLLQLKKDRRRELKLQGRRSKWCQMKILMMKTLRTAKPLEGRKEVAEEGSQQMLLKPKLQLEMNV